MTASSATPDPAYDHYRPDDLDALRRIYRQAFGMPGERTERYLGDLGPGAVRVMRRDGQAVAAAAALDMGQGFGGQVLPCRGVAAVAVDPGERGRGTARSLMTALLVEARARGFALSSLYAALYTLYARQGYARAGIRQQIRMPTAILAGLRPRNPPVSADPPDPALLARLQRARILRSNGLLERHFYLWRQILDPEEGRHDVYLLPGDSGDIRGYVVLGTWEDGTVNLADMALADGAAARDLLALLGGFRAQVETVAWWGGPEDPLVSLAPETGTEVSEWEEWLLRIVDVPKALAGRGYPATAILSGVGAALVLDVEDPLLPDNAGRWRLTVRDGAAAAVERLDTAGPADLALGIGALAPLFTGHRNARDLAWLGLAAGTEAGFDRAALLFAGPKPWMADSF